jgi:hypothetical protein
VRNAGLALILKTSIECGSDPHKSIDGSPAVDLGQADYGAAGFGFIRQGGNNLAIVAASCYCRRDFKYCM